MKQFCIFFILITVGFCNLSAQNDSLARHIQIDSIQQYDANSLHIAIDKSGLFPSFSQNGYDLSAKELSETISISPDARKYMQRAMTCHRIGNALDCAGSIFLAFSLELLRSGYSDTDVIISAGTACLGAGCSLISLPFHAMYTQQAKRAISIYNETPSVPIRDNLEENESHK